MGNKRIINALRNKPLSVEIIEEARSIVDRAEQEVKKLMEVKSKKYIIPVVTRMQDNGDGGYTTYVYNNQDELIADHPKSKNYKVVDGEYFAVKVELTKRQIIEIMDEDDPYENGYIGSDVIEIEIVNGIIRLAKPASFHAGQ